MTPAAAKRSVATRVARAGRRLTKGGVACRPGRDGHWTFAERVHRLAASRWRVRGPPRAIGDLVQPHHKALVVLLQMRQQLVVIAFAIHYMDRARLRSQAGPHAGTPSAQRRLSFCGIPEPGPQCQLRHARGHPAVGRTGPVAGRPAGRAGRPPRPPGRCAAGTRGAVAERRQAGARPAPRDTFSGGVMQHQHIPDRPISGGGRLHMGRDRSIKRDPTIRRKISASVSASLAHASGNPTSPDVVRARR